MKRGEEVRALGVTRAFVGCAATEKCVGVYAIVRGVHSLHDMDAVANKESASTSLLLR